MVNSTANVPVGAAVPDQDRRTEPPPSDLVRSVSRALRVLEVVAEAATPLSAKEVARRSGLHLSTAYHLLRTLCYEGYLLHEPTGDYRPAPGPPSGWIRDGHHRQGSTRFG